jgi:hypothetical protein
MGMFAAQALERREPGVLAPRRAAPASVRRAVAAAGEPLPEPVRRMAGPREDFAAVRVHSDASARDLRADAYTLGHHVVFAPGRYAPHTGPGMRLLVHELAHVVQQHQAQPAPHAALAVGRADDPAEREAEAAADAVVDAGRPAAEQLGAVAQRRASEPVVRRQAAKEQVEPHYPTQEEQKKIEQILRRKREPARPAPARAGAAAPAQQPVVVRGRVLSLQEAKAMAARLQDPILAEITKGGAAGKAGTAVDADVAFEAVKEARTAVYERFGEYAPRDITLTRDEKATDEARKQVNQVLVTFTDTAASGAALVRTVAETDCDACRAALDDLADDSRSLVLAIVVATLQSTHAEEVRKAALAHVGGSYTRARDLVNIPLGPSESVRKTAVHELIHALAHPAFSAAFSDEKHIVEGFTDYFTAQIVSDTGSGYGEVSADIGAVKRAMGGPFLVAIGGAATEESLRLAYFRGRLDLIGWEPSGPKEEADVVKAGGAPKWSADTARTYAKRYSAEAAAAQHPHRNVLGMGLFFRPQQGADPTIAVRYARVLTRTEPYAQWQLLAEGQLLGSPVSDPRTFAASIGLAAEYQEPYFYAAAGGRFVGTAVQGATGNRLDLSPFVGVGIRAWQPIRVGAEGYVLWPLTGGEREYGVGLTVGLEFK